MLVISIPLDHMVKASTCSASSSNHGDTISDTATISGSCSIVGTKSQNSVFVARFSGSVSHCESGAVTQGSEMGEGRGSSGAVSCSSHSP